MPQHAGARLVIEIESARGRADRRRFTARLDDGDAFEGQLVVSPDWVVPAAASRKGALKTPFRPDGPGSSIGTQLFSALFSGGLSRCWAQALDRARDLGGLSVVLRSDDPDIQGLPWELLTDPLVQPPDPIALRDGWFLVRDGRPSGPARQRPEPAEPLPVHDVSAVVFTADNGSISQTDDPRIVREGLDGAHVEQYPDIEREQLQEVLGQRSWHLVHLLATGGRSRRDRAVLLLSPPTNPDSLLVHQIVGALEQMGEPPRLVVLAACDSDLFAAELARYVPNVIGMRGPISDDGCLAFLRGLYPALGAGSRIDEAVAAGRAQLIGFSRTIAEEWAVPVLFLSDATPLVRVDRGERPARKERALPAPAVGDPQEEADHVMLAMNRSNLDSLRSQWQQLGVSTVPGFVQKQIDRLDDEVRRLSAKERPR